MGRARTTLALACALTIVVGAMAGPSAAVVRTVDRLAAKQCGEWRWSIKTLSDSDAGKVNFKPIDRSVNFMRSLHAPSHLSSDTPRHPKVEFKTYRLHVQLLRATYEDDSDVHLVVAQPGAKGHTMIVEFPDTTCQGAAASAKKKQMKKARDALVATCPPISHSSFTKLKGTATVTGAGFWDEIHGQSGVAPNGIELHPVLSIDGTCSKASGGGGGGGGGANCSPAYPDFCIPPPPPDLNCDDPPIAGHHDFTVLPPDPHHLDGDGDGVGCES